MSLPAPVSPPDNLPDKHLQQQNKTEITVEIAPEVPVYNANDEQWESFDWEKYHKRAGKRLSFFDELELRRPDWRDEMGEQLWNARRLNGPTVRWLASDLPTKSLWEHVNADELKLLKHDAMRGFQQAPGSLRREPVQKRIAAWLLQNPDEIHLLLLRWALQNPAPPALVAVETQPDERALREHLPSLIRTFGAFAVSAALAFEGQSRVSGELNAMVNDNAKLEEIMANAPIYGAPKSLSPAAATATESDAGIDKSEPQETADLRAEIEQLNARLECANVVVERGNRARAKVKALEIEVAESKKHETQTVAQFAKKLEQLERKWAAKWDERDKAEAREARRARALQTQLETLEADNKRHKRQVRQVAQLREEERRKVIALEAKLAGLNGETPAQKSADSLDALSSSPTTRHAPNRPIKPVNVSKPSPLDEIFEWMAHGRRVRMTAREVRRLIDRNDEERVGTVMLEMDALKEINPELRKRFLERLGQAGTHYARVLTHSTTRVLVDASNVARALNNRYNKGQLAHLKLMRQELQRLNCWPIVFVADASLPYNIDEPQELREMARQGEIILTDKGVEADEVLAREARATGAYVVTNDAKFFYKVSPDYEPPRISFRVLDGLVTVDEF